MRLYVLMARDTMEHLGHRSATRTGNTEGMHGLDVRGEMYAVNEAGCDGYAKTFRFEQLARGMLFAAHRPGDVPAFWISQQRMGLCRTSGGKCMPIDQAGEIHMVSGATQGSSQQIAQGGQQNGIAAQNLEAKHRQFGGGGGAPKDADSSARRTLHRMAMGRALLRWCLRCAPANDGDPTSEKLLVGVDHPGAVHRCFMLNLVRSMVHMADPKGNPARLIPAVQEAD